MSTANNDNKALLVAGFLIAAYWYMNRGIMGANAVPKTQTGYRAGVMPASAGTGLNQVEAGAITGFFQAILGGAKNNGSTPYVQPDYVAGGSDVVQERVYDFGWSPSIGGGDTWVA